jgi:hypothetical protein
MRNAITASLGIAAFLACAAALLTPAEAGRRAGYDCDGGYVAYRAAATAYQGR